MLEYSVGIYRGGGLFELFVPEEFTDDNEDLVIPNNFEPGYNFNFSVPTNVVRGHIWMYETIEQWFLGERNVFTLTQFRGFGYVKLVRQAIVDEEGLIIRDEAGEPVFEPNFDAPPIHEETGYVVEVISNNGN